MVSFQNGDVSGWIEYPNIDDFQASREKKSDLMDASNAHIGTIEKMFKQELTNIANKDPLYDITVQVS